jgi:hypothetical protein
MSKYRFEILHPYTMIKRWDELLSHIERVVAVSNNEFSSESIKQRVLSGNGIMMVVYENDKIKAVNTAEVVTYDSGLRALLIPIFAGEDMFTWGPEWLEMLSEIAREYNCTELRGLAVRNGWIRALKNYGWKENHIVMTMPVKQLGVI